MKFGRWLVGVSALWLAGLAMAGEGTDRVDAIWSYARDRIDRQTDIWFDDGDFPASIQLLKVASSLSPHDYEVVTNLGWMQENVQDYDDAAKTYQQYRTDNPNDPDRALPLAQFFYLKKQYAKVPPLLEPAMAGKGRPHANVFRMLSGSYEKLGKLGDAQRVLKKYIALAPGDGQAKINLARIEKKMKDDQ